MDIITESMMSELSPSVERAVGDKSVGIISVLVGY